MLGLDEAFTQLLSQGGLLSALLVISFGVNAYLYREARKADTRNDELFEKRLDESRTTLAALERATSSGTALAASIESRSQSINDMAKGFAALAQVIDLQMKHYKEQGDRIERRLDDALSVRKRSRELT